MITKFDNDTIIRFAARHDSFGLNFTRKNRKSEKNPAFQKSALGILPLKSSVSASGMTLSKLIETAELSVRKLLLLQNNLEDEINKHQRYEKDAARRR